MSKRTEARKDLFDMEKGILQFRNKKLTALLKLIPTKKSTRYAFALSYFHITGKPPRIATTDGRRLLVFSRWHTGEPIEDGLYFLGTEGILTKANITDKFPKYEDIIPKGYDMAYKISRSDYWLTRMLDLFGKLPNNLDMDMLLPVLKSLDSLKPYETIVQGKQIKSDAKLDDYVTPPMIVAKISEGQIVYIQMPLNPEISFDTKEMKIEPAMVQIDEENSNEQTHTNGVQRPSECKTAQGG